SPFHWHSSSKLGFQFLASCPSSQTVPPPSRFSALQGGHDPSRTKVLHFSMNPASLAKQQRQEQMGNLREECERLREQIRMLEGPTVPWVDVPQPPRSSEESQGLERLRGLPRGDSGLITIHAVEGTNVVVSNSAATWAKPLGAQPSASCLFSAAHLGKGWLLKAVGLFHTKGNVIPFLQSQPRSDGPAARRKDCIQSSRKVVERHIT
ncbi:hypothetical protein E2320_012241, partial [Naja naja]